jgi:hypothetical protein
MTAHQPLDPALYANIAAGSIGDRRAEIQRQEAERAAERQEQLNAQTSPLNDPQERIRIWERLHALRLPLTPGHKLIRVIAMQTELAVQQVQQEQQRRALALAASRPAG